MRQSIRLAEVSDVSILKDVELSAGHAFNVLPNNVPSYRTVSPDILKAMVQDKHLWVAVDADDGLVGFVACRKIEDFFYVHELSVAHPFQQKGIGRRLMETVIHDAEKKGFPLVGLTTRRDVPWNKPFYSTLGFIEMDELQKVNGLYLQLQKEIEEGVPSSIRCAMILRLPRG